MEKQKIKDIIIVLAVSASVFSSTLIKAQTADSSFNENEKKIYVTLSNFQKPDRKGLPMYDLYSFPKKEFLHPKIKKRLFELLTPVLNEDEKAAYRAYFSKFDEKYIEIKTKEALVKDSTLSYKDVYDSIEKKILKDLYPKKLKT